MSFRITMRNYDCGGQQRSASPRIEYLGIDRPIFGKFVNKIRIKTMVKNGDLLAFKMCML